MNTTHHQGRKILNAILLALSFGIAVRGAETFQKEQPFQEDLGVDVVDGVTNKIIRVSNVTPISVYVVYEGGCSGRKILRQDLPPQLKAKFSYDAAKSDGYQKQQIESAAQQAAAQRLAMKTAIHQKEAEILAEIALLEKQDTDDQKQKNILKSLPPGNGRRLHAASISNDQQNIRERILQLETLLQQVRMQSDRLL